MKGESPKKVTTQEIEALTKALVSCGYEPNTATRGEICQAFKVSDRRARTLQQYIRHDNDGGVLNTVQPTVADTGERHEKTSNSWEISLPKTGIHTLEELLAYAEVDLSEWVVERFIANKYEMASAKDGSVQVTPLFQVKAWLKRRLNMVDIKAEIAALKDEAKKDSKPFPPIKYSKSSSSSSGLMLEVSLPDLHLGKLAWGKETGWDNYDTKLAVEVADKALDALIQRTSSYKFDRILYVIGNDLLHVDNKIGTTTAGTMLSGEGLDGRYQKNFKEARQLITKHLTKLRELAPVTGVVVPGNHDAASTWCLGDSLECLFSKDDLVEIDNRPLARKYVQWGNVMIMLAHGNCGKLTDYPLLMAVEQPEMFGATEHREAHTGDKHHLKVNEIHGIRVRISPALCPPDFWHSEKTFVGAARSAEAFIWSRTEGLIGTAIFSVPSAPKVSS